MRTWRGRRPLRDVVRRGEVGLILCGASFASIRESAARANGRCSAGYDVFDALGLGPGCFALARCRRFYVKQGKKAAACDHVCGRCCVSRFFAVFCLSVFLSGLDKVNWKAMATMIVCHGEVREGDNDGSTDE